PHAGTLLRLAGGDHAVEVSVLSRVRQAPTAAEMAEMPGVVALAAELVSCDHPDLADLPAQLLSHTLIVRDLSAARALADQRARFRLVTLQGELLEPDGTLTVGTQQAAAGILARKSELADLQEQATAVDAQIVAADRALADMRQRLIVLDELIERQ